MKTVKINSTIGGRLCVSLLCAAGAFIASARPTVSDVTINQSGSSRKVTVNYRITGEKAIVTLDIQTNGVSIGAANFANAVGDVNMMIEPSEDLRTITWQPVLSWPNQIVEDKGLKAVVKAHTFDDPPDYMVVDLTVKDTIRFYDSVEQVPGGDTNDIYKTDKMLFSRIPAAGVEWRMGSPTETSVKELGRNSDEVPHLVKLSRDYYMAVYETTYQQWDRIGGSSYTTEANKLKPFTSPYGSSRGTGWPASGHATAGGLAKKLRDRACGFMFDLPTEAEWEFACRGGYGTALNNGTNLASADAATDENVELLAVYKGNSGTPAAVADVGTKQKNRWGLYDMHGNYNEWVLDWYVADLSTLPTLDPKGGETGDYRVFKGGDYNKAPKNQRSAWRGSRDQWADYGGVGTRFCCPVPMDAQD